MPEPIKLTPVNKRTHYCRECGQSFEWIDPQMGPTPHAATWIHNIREHTYGEQDYQSCSRYCQNVAQPEEIAAGHRMYGKNAPALPKPLTTYDNLFPLEKD